MELKEERPAYVRFETRAVEDRDASIERGHYVTRDVEYALVTPPYSRDCVEFIASEWLRQIDTEVSAGRLPGAWRDQYKSAYQAWKAGNEIPLNGTPVKGWQLLSPAQQSNLIHLGFLTVEDIAGMNDEGQKRYGMGALDMKNKAQAWLNAAAGTGKVAAENAALKAKLDALEEQNALLREQNKALADASEKRGPGRPRKELQAA